VNFGFFSFVLIIFWSRQFCSFQVFINFGQFGLFFFFVKFGGSLGLILGTLGVFSFVLLKFGSFQFSSCGFGGLCFKHFT
jgi:hypothetical protein